MLRYSLDFRLEPHPELVLEPLGGLEVGLDCVQCGKLCRTVEVDGLGARCTPTGHVYPARLVTVDCHSEGGQLMLRAEFEYDYQAFVASAGKLAGEPSREEPGWARIAFRADLGTSS